MAGRSRVRDTRGGHRQPEEAGGGVRGGVGAGEGHPEGAAAGGGQLLPEEDDHHFQPERAVLGPPPRRHNQACPAHAHQAVQRQSSCFDDYIKKIQTFDI